MIDKGSFLNNKHHHFGEFDKVVKQGEPDEFWVALDHGSRNPQSVELLKCEQVAEDFLCR